MCFGLQNTDCASKVAQRKALFRVHILVVGQGLDNGKPDDVKDFIPLVDVSASGSISGNSHLKESQEYPEAFADKFLRCVVLKGK